MNEQIEIAVVTDLTNNQIDQLVLLYRNEFWSNRRSRSDVESMLANTDIVIGVEDRSNNIVGFVRILTDYVYKAIVFDLIVHPKWRGKKVGKFLMNTVINHPKLRNVEHFDLNCLPKMYEFYEQWEFTAEVGELGFMRRFNNTQ